MLDQKKWAELEKELSDAGHSLVPVAENLIDVVWSDDRPQRPCNPVIVLEVFCKSLNSY